MGRHGTPGERVPGLGPAHVWLVGAGPGDPKLLTLRAEELLREADLVVYDHLVSPGVLRRCAPRARLLYVGKEAEQTPRPSQSRINRLLVRAARAGERVVRLKGGDPFLFGRGGEEALALARARIAFEVVPGVSSATAVPAYAGIPLTHRGLASSVGIITGHEDPGKARSAIRWQELTNACDTLVCLMGVGRLPAIVRRLQEHGRPRRSPCAVIEWGTSPRQRTVQGTLETIVARAREAAIRPPAILIVGEVARLRSRLNWFERRPLFGARIVVTRAAEKAASLAGAFQALGADVLELPAIELVPVAPGRPLREALRRLPEAGWVFFTSPEGIGWFAKILRRSGKDLRALSGCRIGAIGAKTAAAIEARGLRVDFIPRRFSQEGVLEGFPAKRLRGQRAFIFSAAGSRDVLLEGLRARGMQVAKVPIYRSLMPSALRAGLRQILREGCDLVTVTSASCVEHVWRALEGPNRRALFKTLRFASIGPVTSAAVRARGGRVTVEASPSTSEGLIAAILRSRRSWRT